MPILVFAGMWEYLWWNSMLSKYWFNIILNIASKIEASFKGRCLPLGRPRLELNQVALVNQFKNLNKQGGLLTKMTLLWINFPKDCNVNKILRVSIKEQCEIFLLSTWPRRTVVEKKFLLKTIFAISLFYIGSVRCKPVVWILPLSVLCQGQFRGIVSSPKAMAMASWKERNISWPGTSWHFLKNKL